MLQCHEGDYCPPVPHPPRSRLGFIELLTRLRRNPLECWSEDFFREPIVKLRLPFTDAFVVHDPHAIKHVLMDRAGNYPKDTIQRRILSSGLSDGLLSVDGERWEVQRRTLAPIFARRNVTSFTMRMLVAANELSAKWSTMGPDATVDVAAEMTLVTLNVLALTIFSDGIGDDLDEFRMAMNVYFSVIGRIGALDLLGVPKYVPRPGHRRLRATMAYFEAVIDRIIDVRCRGRTVPVEGPSDLLALLLRSPDPSTGRQLSPREIRSNVLTFLSAGHETTANTLAWSIFLLSQSPEWRSRVASEAERELSNPADDLAERLVVTKAVIEEALRLYPPIAALSRTAREADRLGDLAVGARSLIVIAPYVLHRHHRLWRRPDAFDPSRFLGEARGAIPRFAYLPFGVGPRTCIGASFALQEAAIVLAVLIRDFEMRVLPNADVQPLQRITLRPAHGLPMAISRRSTQQRP
ncbi:cytochrome P450 [Bradyrhizobium sp. USDA 4461]